MKLYKFSPSGHGQYSFYIVAETETNATLLVHKHIMANHFGNETTNQLDYFAEGWPEDYSCEVADIGNVLWNAND